MSRPCTCDKVPATGQPYSTKYCRLCWLYHNNAGYRNVWESNNFDANVQVAALLSSDAEAVSAVIAPSEVYRPIDWCVPLLGPNAHLFARLYLGSVLRVCDLINITFHLIDKSLTPEQRNEISKIARGFKKHPLSSVVWHELPLLPEKKENGDVAETFDYMATKCGNCEWFIFSHYDMMFHHDFVSHMRRTECHNRYREKVAIIGHRFPIMMMNRQAYAESHFKFVANGGPFYLVPESNPHQAWKIRHGADARSKSHGAIHIQGFDAGELMELELQSKGWKTYPFVDQFNSYFWHHGDASRDTNKQQIADNQQTVMRMCAEHNY